MMKMIPVTVLVSSMTKVARGNRRVSSRSQEGQVKLRRIDSSKLIKLGNGFSITDLLLC